MGLITDEMVIEAVRCCGTATTTMVYDFLENILHVPRDIISSRTGKKLRQLVKYGLLCSMVFEKRLWYYTPDTTPNPIPMKPLYGTERVRERVKALDTGDHICVEDVVDMTGCTKSHARRVLSHIEGLNHDNPNSYCKVGI